MDTRKLDHSIRSITTTEIARRCGVSRSTVSAVLNGKRNIRESTRKRVLECIRREHYESGMIARSLVGEMSRMVAVLCPSVGNPFDMVLFRGIHEALGAQGYHILFHGVRPGEQNNPLAMASLLEYRPAGYIMLKGLEGHSGALARRILEDEIPLVTQGQVSGMNTDSVGVDDRVAMRLAADYVIGLGHRRLAHLGGPPLTLTAKERQMGFVESLIEHDISVSDATIVNAGETPAAGYISALELLKDERDRPTALVCYNDMVAMGAYRAAHELGLSIPRDLSVVGFDGIEFGALLGPPLTTVDVCPLELGQRAAQLLVEAIEGRGGRSPKCEWVDAHLLVRGSVGRMPAPETTATDRLGTIPEMHST